MAMKTILIENLKDLTALCKILGHVPFIGLDTETALIGRPPRLSLVQIADEKRSWIIDVLSVVDISPLKDILENENTVKIIHNAAFEKAVLAPYGMVINNIFDTFGASRKLRKKPKSGGHNLKDVAMREIGVTMDKTLQASDWLKRPLTREMKKYAALDAIVLPGIYKVFIKDIETSKADL
jgi:ribonuclease D